MCTRLRVKIEQLQPLDYIIQRVIVYNTNIYPSIGIYKITVLLVI
jgi:hypothetical protein